jgi:glutamate synthase domain-containing protein 2
VTILQVASESGVDLVTFDGAGGGSGHSPVRMMNEWGIPTVSLESIVWRIMRALAEQGRPLPQVAMAGGFVMEDHVLKGLALGSPYVGLIALGRSAMAAATVGRNVGAAIRSGAVPRDYARFGSSVEDVFGDLRLLESEYGKEAKEIPTGALGLYSYLNRVSVGLRQLMALNRKFALRHIEREDVVPLTEHASRVSGLPTYEDLATRTLSLPGRPSCA